MGLIPAKAFQPLKLALAVSSLKTPWFGGVLPGWEVRPDTQVGMPQSIAMCPRVPALGIPGKPVRP